MVKRRSVGVSAIQGVGAPCVPGSVLTLSLVLCMLTTGCATVAQVTTLSERACFEAMRNGLDSILVEQEENPEVAGRLASDATAKLEAGGLGPRPFLLRSSSGVDYSFFVQRKDDGCLLRLYGRDKGFTSYTNNLTYIATRPLAPCGCSE